LLTAPTSRISLTVWTSGCNTGTERPHTPDRSDRRVKRPPGGFTQ
jgi:hypothetical protein